MSSEPNLDRFVAMFAGLVLLLVVALTIVTLTMLARQRRRRRRSTAVKSDSPLPDAWAEAGRRAQPFNPRDPEH